MSRMSLIVFEKTGHVLGAFTRTADPDGAVTADQVVGEAVVLRDPDTGDEWFHVASSFLTVKTIDRVDDAILSHRHYVLKEGLASEKADPLTQAAYDTTGQVMEVTLDAVAPDKLTVFAQFEVDGEAAKVVPIEIPAGTDFGSAPVTLTPSTTYQLLVLIPGYRAQFLTAVG